MRNKSQLFLLVLMLLLLAGINGCRTVQAQKTSPPAAEPPQKVTLPQAVRTAVRKSAEMKTLESLQLIAREHVEKSRLLELPDMIYDLPRRLSTLTVEKDLRLDALDHALESCRILTRPAQSDLNAVQRKVEEKKIRRDISFKWAKLAYFRNLKKAGLKSASLAVREKETVLELSISSGIPEKMIENFDLDSLPDPIPIPLPPEPEYVRSIKTKYDSSPDTALRFADIAYRLPAELLHRKDSNYDAAFALAYAVGTSVKLDIVKIYLDKAYENFIKAENAYKKAQVKTPELCAELEENRLSWRLAFFRMKYDLSAYPEKVDPKEQNFLFDLISLQGK